MKKLASVALGMAAATLAQPALASVTIGGYTFDDNAFVDQLVSSSGAFNTSGGSLASVLTDASEATYAFSSATGAFVELAFTDNLAVNGTGADIVLFELGLPDELAVTINGITQIFGTLDTGFSAGGFALNAAAIDLSAFGIASGGTISSLQLAFPYNPSTQTYASLSLVGALNSASVSGAVPEPATWALMILGFAAVGGTMRSQKRRERTTIRYA